MVSELPLVAFNAQLASGATSYRSAGISAYILNLLRTLSQQDGLRYTIFVGDERLPIQVPFSTYRSHFPTASPPARILWEQLVLPMVLRHLGADLLHAPAFVGPLLSSCPQVITVHDLSFLRHPEFFRTGNRIYLKWMTRWACRRAKGVIAVSKFTAAEVSALLGVPPDRVHVVYHGVQSRFHPLPAEEVDLFRRKQGLPDRFILYLGTLEPRKNLITLIQAFARLPFPDVHLVLAGGKGWLYEEIFAEVERLEIEDRIHFPGYVPAETQTFWYNAAYLFAYLSHYEGFGLPILESLACGTPALIAEGTSLPEAGGPGALAVEGNNVEAVTGGLQRMLVDEEFRADLRRRGLKHATCFDWGETARQTTALYRNILASQG